MSQTPTAPMQIQSNKIPLKNKNQNDLINIPVYGKNLQSQKPSDNSQLQKTTINPLRNLSGKLVFLDIHNSFKLLNKVKECLNLIDTKFADCLSKEVNYVITNREKPNEANLSPEARDPTKKLKTSPNFLSRSCSLINRTQAILEKASKGTPSTDILSTARRLGITVMNVSEIEKYIEKYTSKKRSLEANDKANLSIEYEDNKAGLKDCTSVLSQGLTKTSNHKICKLRNNFLKFESVCKQYKPIHQEFDSWHEINFDAITNKFTNSPFQVYFSDDNGSSNCSTENDDKNDQDKNKSNSSSQITANQNVFKSPNSSNILTNSCSKTVQNKPSNSRVALTRTPSFTANAKVQPNLNIQTNNNIIKKKPAGYCECCKQRYDNLKQHLTSAQHDNFERNQSNFKEIDTYINGILNFKQFLIKKNLLALEKKEEKEENLCESINLDEMKKFARNFNERRAILGISQHQIAQALNAEFKDPILTETAISKFERLDITPRSSAKVRPILEKLMSDSQLKFGDRLKIVQNENDLSKKRKRNGSFSLSALEILNEKFTKNPEPKQTEISIIANQINYDEDLIKNWFNEKKQKLKPINSMKKFKKTNVVNTLNLLENNTSLLDETSSTNTSFNAKEEKDAQDEKLHNSSRQATPIKQMEPIKNLLKKTPPLVSSFSLSSPSAAVLFGLNSHNSFTIPVDLAFNGPLNTSAHHNTSATAKLLASKVDLMSNATELQTIKANIDGNSSINNPNNKSRSENSTDLSCIDDVVLAAFVNDFSYEIVQK